MNFDICVLNVTCHTLFRLQFQKLRRLNRPEDRAVYYYVRHGDAPLDTRILTDYERGRQVVSRAHIADDLTIYSQSTGKGDVTNNYCPRSN